MYFQKQRLHSPAELHPDETSMMLFNAHEICTHSEYNGRKGGSHEGSVGWELSNSSLKASVPLKLQFFWVTEDIQIRSASPSYGLLPVLCSCCFHRELNKLKRSLEQSSPWNRGQKEQNDFPTFLSCHQLCYCHREGWGSLFCPVLADTVWTRGSLEPELLGVRCSYSSNCW